MLLYENDIQRLNDIQTYLLNNLGDRVLLSQLVLSFHISPSTLKRHFKNHFGTSITKYLKQVRMQKAVELLRQGKHVKEVAALVGYNDSDAFSRAFKHFFGIAPLQLLKVIESESRHHPRIGPDK